MSTLTAESTETQTRTNRHIRKVAVLGAGVMGSKIAMHFANVGVQAVCLDIVPRELTQAEQQQGLSLDDPQVRNRQVNELFQDALKASPSPIYDKALKDRIELGNFEDHMHKVADCDWIIEVVVERLDIKQKIFDQVEQHRKPGTLITSNTSGIPIESMLEGRSQDFQEHFCGTHFFNPPRYLPLLEIIPSSKTRQDVIDFLMHYGDLYLGKNTVLCKDTPAFIANRVGIFAIMQLLHLVEKYEMTVEEVDELTGKLIGHPKSATFRTLDLVGMDTMVKVANGIVENCPDDERNEVFKLPGFVQYMVDNELYGDKTGKGFYQKIKQNGESQILSFDWGKQEYRDRQKPKDSVLENAKSQESPEQAMQVLIEAEGRFGDFFREFAYGLFAYVSNRIPEIADELFRIDEAVKAGFGWGTGAFEKWDIIGAGKATEAAEKYGFKVADWVHDMLKSGTERFYKVEKGRKYYYDIPSKGFKEMPGMDNFIILDYMRESNVVWSNSGSTIFDLGDGILNIEFHTKMNSIGQEIIEGMHKAIDLAEERYAGLVVGNHGENFSAGANIMMIMMYAAEEEWDDLNFAIKTFQDTNMRLRYSDVPVVVAPHDLTLGGGCEMTMHADAVQAAAETYIGLVEVGVGVLPGGGGTKELAKRASDRFRSGDPETNIFQEILMNIGQAKVATSALEAYPMMILEQGKDRLSINKQRQIADAKQYCRLLAEQGYTRPLPPKIRVMGKAILGAVETGVYQLKYAGYASDHDEKIARKIGYVLAGGDLSEEQAVSEQYLLDLEREAFLSLAGERKSQERMQHMLQTGKPLRN